MSKVYNHRFKNKKYRTLKRGKKYTYKITGVPNPNLNSFVICFGSIMLKIQCNYLFGYFLVYF